MTIQEEIKVADQLRKVREEGYEKGYEDASKLKRIAQKMYLQEVEKNKKVREETIEEIKEDIDLMIERKTNYGKYNPGSDMYVKWGWSDILRIYNSLKDSPKDKEKK